VVTGSEEPGVGITGSIQSAVFRMDLSDDESVELPVNAISSAEVLDEPGVASVTWADGYSLPPGYHTILSRSITAPSAGYALVIATAQAISGHTSGSRTDCEFGVSAVIDSLPGNQDIRVSVSQFQPTDLYDHTVTVHGLFELSAPGTRTFHFVANSITGYWDIYNVQLTVVYFPTAYGFVDPTAMYNGSPDAVTPQKGGMTEADLAAERVESEAANRARMEREVAEMRARLDRLEAELAAEREGR
jgi:hypothetical protein